MSKKEIFVKCEVCERDKKKSEFYSSSDSTHKNGCITICKKCAMNMVDMNNIETLRAFLERVNKPFIYTLYQSSINSKRRSSPLGNYFSNINMSSFKELTWKDSEGLEDALKDNYKEMFKTKDEIKEEKKLEEKSELQKELDDLGIDEKELIKLKKFWGMGHTPTEYHSYQVKYDSLVDNYSNQTTLHTEALKSYCVLKVKSEMLIANGGSTGDIKAFSELAQKQGEIAKLNLNKLDKSDFTSGMDSFGELVRMVEQEVDIIPILPQFTERPQDKIDVAIHCFLNYERRLAGMPDVEYDEIYDFYQKSLQDYLEDDTKSQEIKKYIVKKKIVRPNGTTREILFYDVYAVIEEKKRLNKDNKFIQNLDKWVEFISWARWNVDLWYDMITPESNSIALDVDQRMTLRIMSRYKFVYLVFPRGFSKCVTGDTMLFTESGIKEIGSFFNYQDDDVETYFNHNFKTVNRYGNLEETKKGIYSGYKPTIKLQTEEGYEIEGTEEHPLLVMNDNGELVWKKIKDITNKDFITINRKNDVWGNNTRLDVSKDYMDKWLCRFDENSNKWKVELSSCNVITELDDEFALILGYLIGDGRMTRDNVVIFSNIDKEIISKYVSFMEDKLGVKVTKKKGSNCDYITNGMYTREYFRKIGLNMVDSYGKTIPQCILDAPKNIVKSFMIGLFDTDGMVDNARVSVCTASEKMSKQIQTVLLNFGIVSTRRKKHNKQFNTYSYTVDIYGSNITRFHNEIGFGCSRKKKTLEKSIQTKRNTNKDIIPFQQKLINDYFNSNRKVNKHNALLYDRLYHVRKGDNELTYYRIDDIINSHIGESIDEIQKIKELQDLNYFYSKVETLENKSNHVYDIQMSDTSSFIANGIVSHNTFLQLMYNFHTCIFYPNMEIAMTAQTMENASSLVESKWREILRFFPLLEKELKGKPLISKEKAIINFKSGGMIDTLQNGQSAKGQRRKRLSLEEFAQVSLPVFQDCLEPIPNIPRITLGKHGTINPYELNGQIIYLTTSWYVNTDAYDKSLQMRDNMIALKGDMVIGSDWTLACELGRGESRSTILERKMRTSSVAFSLNYESRWIGIISGGLVSINKVMDLRTLTRAELQSKRDAEYIISVDVARSQSTDNNQCSVAVLKIKRNKQSKIIAIQLVNMINIPSIMNFRVQAQEIMRIKNRYKAKMCVVDANGLGVGLIDELTLEQIDPQTGDSLGCWKTINTDQDSETSDAEECLYALKSQSINNEVIVSFIDAVESGKLQLLEKRTDVGYDLNDKDHIEQEVAPFAQTDLLLEEIANLKLEVTSSGKFTVKQNSRRTDRDRYSSVSYGIWYISEYEDNYTKAQEGDMSDFLLIN